MAELAVRLGAEDQRAKVGDYYHQMEQGTLPADGVSDTVLEALGDDRRRGRDALRKAGSALGPGPEGSTRWTPTFARGACRSKSKLCAPRRRRESPDAPEPDEVDRLFTGG